MSGVPAEVQSIRELVTFFLDDEQFGVDVKLVLEVNRDLIWTPIPGAPGHVLGAANLRGHIVTILDIRQILHYGDRPEGASNTVLIVTANNELVGILVDRIADVIDIDGSSIQSPPKNLPSVQRGCISGVLQRDGQLLAVLNMHIVLK